MVVVEVRPQRLDGLVVWFDGDELRQVRQKTSCELHLVFSAARAERDARPDPGQVQLSGQIVEG